jgi:hypothetical protein
MRESVWWVLWVVAVGVLWVGGVSATCGPISEDCWTCCAPGGPCSTHCSGGEVLSTPPPSEGEGEREGEGYGPPGWYGRVEMGIGYTEPMGQLERALDGSPFLSGRMMMGGGYRGWFGGLVLLGTNLQSDEVSLGWNDLWLQVFALDMGYDWGVMEWEDGEGGVGRWGVTVRGEGGWAILGGGEYDDYGGWEVGGGVGVFWEGGETREPFRYRWWLDVGVVSPQLESERRGRHMRGDMWMMSLGVSGLVWGS